MISLIKELRAPVKKNKEKAEQSPDDPKDKEELEIKVCIILNSRIYMY